MKVLEILDLIMRFSCCALLALMRDDWRCKFFVENSGAIFLFDKKTSMRCYNRHLLPLEPGVFGIISWHDKSNTMMQTVCHHCKMFRKEQFCLPSINNPKNGTQFFTCFVVIQLI